MFSQNKAEIVGFLCAEGNYYNKFSDYLQYYPNRGKNGKHYKIHKRNIYIQFANFNQKILKRFYNLLEAEYNYSPRIYSDRIKICRRDIIRDLIKCSNYGCLKWSIPKEIKNNTNLAIRFLYGYFEGDGCSRENKIVFSSSNFNGLKQVRTLLDKLSINNTLQGPYFRKNREPEYFVYIKRDSWDRFFNIIKPNSKLHPTIMRLQNVKSSF